MLLCEYYCKLIIVDRIWILLFEESCSPRFCSNEFIPTYYFPQSVKHIYILTNLRSFWNNFWYKVNRLNKFYQGGSFYKLQAEIFIETKNLPVDRQGWCLWSNFIINWRRTHYENLFSWPAPISCASDNVILTNQALATWGGSITSGTGGANFNELCGLILL